PEHWLLVTIEEMVLHQLELEVFTEFPEVVFFPLAAIEVFACVAEKQPVRHGGKLRRQSNTADPESREFLKGCAPYLIYVFLAGYMCSWLDICIPGWPWTGHSAWRATADCYRVGDGAGGRAKVGNRVGVLEDLEMRRRQVD